MDGFDELEKSPQWPALKRAKDAVFELEALLKADTVGAVNEAFSARVELIRVENQLRAHYKRSL